MLEPVRVDYMGTAPRGENVALPYDTWALICYAVGVAFGNDPKNRAVRRAVDALHAPHPSVTFGKEASHAD